MSTRKNKLSADSPTPISGDTVSPSSISSLTSLSPTQIAKKTYGGRGRRVGKGDDSKISPKKETETEEGVDGEKDERENIITPVETLETPINIEELPKSSSKCVIAETDSPIESTAIVSTVPTTNTAEPNVVDTIITSVTTTATKEPPASTQTTDINNIAISKKKKGRAKSEKPTKLPMKRQIGTRNLGLKSPKLLTRRSLQDVKAKAKSNKINRRATLAIGDKKQIKIELDKKKQKQEADKKEIKTEKDIKLEDIKNEIKIESDLKIKTESKSEVVTITPVLVKRKGRPPKHVLIERAKRKLEEEEGTSLAKTKKAKIELNLPSIESIIVPTTTGISSTSIEEILKDVKSRLAPMEQDAADNPSKCSETDTESISEKMSETCESVVSQEDTRAIIEELNIIKNIKQEAGDTTDTEGDAASKQKNLDKKPVRRSGRPRKNTVKDREIASPKLVCKTEIKFETAVDETSLDSAITSTNDDASQTTEDITSLHIDTVDKCSAATVETKEKASLSPLESEGVSEISVKQFYGEPAFLENNRGIEKDPKLGEIVQVHEKISLVQNVDENAIMDSDSIENNKENVIKELKLLNEKEDLDFLKEDESLGELKMDDSIDEELEEKLLNSDEDTQLKDLKSVDIKMNCKLEEDLLKEDNLPKNQNSEDNNNTVSDEDQTTNCSDETAILTEETVLPVKSAEKSIKEKNVEKQPEKEVINEQEVVIDKPTGEKKIIIVDEKKLIIVEKKEIVNKKEVITDEKQVIVEDTKKVVDAGKVIAVEEKKVITEEKKTIIPEIIQKVITESGKEPPVESKKSKVATTSLTPPAAIKSKDLIKIVSESPETLRLKESHLKLLGLLTIKEADEAKKEKLRQKEIMQSSSSSSTSSTGSSTSKSKSRNSNNNNNNTSNGNNNKDKDKEEYTGTLKTVIKVPRPSNSQNEKRKRLPLKMTFQKGRGKNGNEKDSNAPDQSGDDVYYTIQNEGEGHDSAAAATHGGHNSSRKTHNRTHTDGNIVSEPSEAAPGQEVKKALVIPEKASSFSIHPGRVCRDQCFYCGGKFGLFDTPCHVAQIKSLEKQKKILDNEEKLTVDSCLCDACYRHVDRRANCPSYKKRLSAPGALSTISQHNNEQSRENSSEESVSQQSLQKQGTTHPKIMCCVTNCFHIATQHSLRRKWFLKMKKSIDKLININLEANSSHNIPICDIHYDAISHLMVCTLCKRKLPKNHIFYIIYQEIDILEKNLKELGIPLSLGTTPVVCKICRYFANLLLKPPEAKTQKAQFVKTYRSRLLQLRSIEIMETSDSDNNNQIPIKIQQNPPVKSKPKAPQTVTKLQKTPQKETSTFIPQESFDGNGGHILLDNDVMVNYDVPMMNINTQSSQQKRQQHHVYGPKHAKLPRYSNDSSAHEANNDMARILRANPNISMRELLPGEEDLGMHATIPFHNGKKTPEGWSKVQTIIQYDDVTKQMFEELQKPYGNQSSFLRHLVLLEKYFRNGDLVLSQNASYNAMSYSESVQTRLKSYDNVPTGGLPIMQQLSVPMEVTPTVTIKPKQKIESRSNSSFIQTSSSTSLLRNSNNSHHPSTSSQHSSTKANRQISVTTESNQQEILAAASKYIQLDETTIMPASKKSSGAIPPELISITKNNQPAIAITPITNRKSPGPNVSSPPASMSTAITPPVPTASTSASISISNAPSTSSANSSGGKPSVSIPLQQQQHQNLYQHQKQIIKLPETLNANERKQTNGKPWRPTLLPITQGALNIQQQGPLYQTADGRRLPSLVQVMSGGKPYHISIEDYNRMCILRREKLIQLQMSKEQNNNHNTSGSSTNSNNSSSNAGNSSGNTPSINNSSNKQSSASDDCNNRNSNISNLVTFVGTNNKKLINIPNKILEQNSLIPVGSNKSNNLNERKRTKSGGGGGGGNGNGTSLLKTHIPIAPKPPQLPNSTTVLAVPSSSSLSSSVMKQISQSPPHSLTITTTNSSPSNSTIITTSTATVTLPPSIEMIKTSGGGGSGYSWPSNLSMDQSINGYTISTPCSGGGTLLIDNSAVSVLSKIPKSLTVIPQQKGRSRVPSIEDLTSA